MKHRARRIPRNAFWSRRIPRSVSNLEYRAHKKCYDNQSHPHRTSAFAVAQLTITACEAGPITMYLQPLSVSFSLASLCGIEVSALYAVKFVNSHKSRPTVSFTTTAYVSHRGNIAIALPSVTIHMISRLCCYLLFDIDKHRLDVELLKAGFL